jgi:cytosine/adenosine deaminase-related metal-dependent hydrolase
MHPRLPRCVLLFGVLTACSSPPADPPDAAVVDASRDVPAIPGDAAVGVAAESCPNSFAPCVPAAGSTRFVRVRGTVVTPDRVICDGEVLFSAETGRIACVGQDCSASPNARGAQVVCSEGVIFPGLIDPHQHADHNHMPVFRHERRYDNRNTWREHEPLYDTFKIPHRPFGSTSRTNQRLAQRYAEVRLAFAGTTSMSGTAGTLLDDVNVGGWVRNLDSFDVAGSGLTGAYVDPDIDSVLVSSATGQPNETTTATHLASVRMRMTTDRRYRAFLPHIAEGIDVNARSEFDVADRNGVITEKTAIVHCLGCSTAQYARMAAVGADLIWSPRSNIDLYGETADVTTAHALGITVALGVDWTPSGSMNLIGELQCAAHLNERYYARTFSDVELVAMATVNGAIAMNLDDSIGRLAPDYQADLAVFAGDRTRPYRALLDARAQDVRLVVVAGRAIYGDAPLLAGTVVSGMGCMAVPDGMSPMGMSGVCGVRKVVCAQPSDLAGLRGAIAAALEGARVADAMCMGAGTGDYCYAYELYPLFRCGGPELDRCDFGHGPIPRRATGGGMIPPVSGVPMAGADDDGDGVPNTGDNCPRIFNPPFDLNPTQDDADGDGTGDACDPTPCTRADGSNACPMAAAPIDGGVADAGARVDGGADAGRRDSGTTDLGVLDAGPADTGLPCMGATCSCGPTTPMGWCAVGSSCVRGACAAGATAGAVVITEIMNDPNAVTDTLGEWFEVYNPAETPVDLRGLRVRGSGTEMFEVTASTPLLVPGRGYAVLGKNGDMATNGGVQVLYAYGSAMDLGNGAATPDTITLLASDGTTLIDAVTYTNAASAGWPATAGRSKSLRPMTLDATMNDLPAAWCSGGPAYGRGDSGTPGAANVCM